MSRRALCYSVALVSTLAVFPGASDATTSTESVGTPFGGNGHNISFDGRILITRRGPDDPSGGWMATVLRPERIVVGQSGMPDFGQGAFSPFKLVQAFEAGENALALCEPAPAPYACDEAGSAGVGPYACYDFQVIDSNAYPDQDNSLRRRALKLWVANPQSADADVHKWTWGPVREVLSRSVGGPLKGIEPTVTADGHMMVWQGHPDNDGKIDILMYATNATACGATGWDGPHNLGRMFTDPKVNGVYPLGERTLRAADGTAFGAGDKFRGAYPWLFPDGEAINFTSVNVPCRATEDPPGCGPRRGGLAVIGYPTNWSLSHIDGGANPDTDQTVRLFFSSPGPNSFPQLPVTSGLDVWPMFGSNTQNYVELVFDDGLDGGYAAVWHMNEMVDREGNLDRTRTPDVSGYFNTGMVRGAQFPLRNNAPNGKALVFDGTGAHVFVPHDPSLDPVNSLEIEMRLRLDSDPDCDAENNYRFLLGKGNIATGSYTLILEESRQLQARVNVGGVQRALVSSAAIPVGAWSHVVFAFDGGTGELTFQIDGAPAGSAIYPAGTLAGSSGDLTIGGPGGNRAACPAGDGAFAGAIDEIRIRRGSATPPPDPDMGPTNPDMGGVEPGTDAGAPADMGSPNDLGVADSGGGTGADEGMYPPGPDGWGQDPVQQETSGGEEGCACASVGDVPRPAPGLLLALAGLALLRRKR